jgi:arsenite/tail-anchored protein-transporting ATPase
VSAARRTPARVLLFTGKGGVGKTTVAAATAAGCAARGQRTVVLSTDPAHSLADAFDRTLGDTATEIAPGLWGQQLDARVRFEAAWSDVRSYLVDVLDWAGAGTIDAEELSVIPGLEEIFALAEIKAFVEGGEFDTVVVDCAPTAETLRLLSLPDILSWYMARVFETQRRLTKLAKPMLARLTSMPVMGDTVFAAVRRLYERVDGVRDILTDGARTSVRLVVNPERMVLAEARRTYTYLSLFGHHVDAVVANRLLPAAVSDPWFDRWREVQARHLDEISAAFAPLPVLTAELVDDEIIGHDALSAFATVLYGDDDPAERRCTTEPMRVEPRGESLLLSMHLPFTDKRDIEVGRVPDELYLAVGPHRRAVVLPDSLARREVVGAHFDDDRLVVEFA